MAVNKVNWSQVGRVSVPGRYMFKFGWLTITEQELAVWRQFPNASFTLYRPSSAETEDDFRLGAFDLPESNPGSGQIHESVSTASGRTYESALRASTPTE